ncbi:MAG: hypothetical protein ACI85K_001017 [Hyphomicrobiaceae bacterium]|jgi:hypothetical protein
MRCVAIDGMPQLVANEVTDAVDALGGKPVEITFE